MPVTNRQAQRIKPEYIGKILTLIDSRMPQWQRNKIGRALMCLGLVTLQEMYGNLKGAR